MYIQWGYIHVEHMPTLYGDINQNLFLHASLSFIHTCISVNKNALL